MRILARLKYAIPFVASGLLAMLVVTKSTPTPAGSVSQAHMISDPAAVYCTDMGYKYQVISDATGGQAGTCRMPDGKVCDAWDFLEGKCGKAYSYCAKQGLGVRTATDGNNPFSPEYAVCVDAQGKDAGSMTTLFDLAPKLIHCGVTSLQPGTSNNTTNATPPAQTDSNPPLVLTGTPPTSWDWRNATYNSLSGDWTTPVKDQANCGSCWAMSTVGQTEAVINLYANNPALDENLAEEYLVSDCLSAGGCCGANLYVALDFIKNQGIPDEACLPWVSSACGCDNGHCTCTYRSSGNCANATCSQRCSDYGSRLSKIDSYGSVSSDRTAIKQALITYGPLSVTIDMEGYFDANGVYKCFNPRSIDHAVAIVGYEDAGGYWLVKNSWGSDWNGNGYFKMGYGQCLIENEVYWAHAAANIRTISGYLRTLSGSGISGVVMNGLPDNPTTDTNGFYSDQVNNGWSGTVSPSKADYFFNPTTLNYSNITRNKPNQNYTGQLPQILLVDDDDNSPDVRTYYSDTLTALGKPYDVWDTSTSYTDPDATTLAKYFIVIWFTGDKSGSNTGPDGAGEAALVTFLNGGGNLFISSQDYYKNRGLTAFMSAYLGVSSATDDTMQTTVTGTGSVFNGLGPYTLNYPFINLSDTINSGGSAETAFSGNQGNAGVDKNDGYHVVYLGFPFEALPSATARLQVLHAFLEWCYHTIFLPLVMQQ